MKNIIIGFLLGISIVLVAADFDVKVHKPIVIGANQYSVFVVCDDGAIYNGRYSSFTDGVTQWKRSPNIPPQ